MSDLSRAYETYAEEAQRMARLERDPKATPRQRRLQAHAVRQAWWTFLEEGKPKPKWEVAAVEVGSGLSRRRVEYVERQPRRTLWKWAMANRWSPIIVGGAIAVICVALLLLSGAIFHG
jgi:hypothetical protein